MNKHGTAITLQDEKFKSPYNTYLHTGLPPGPIGNPGLDAIKAALHPVKASYLYFITDTRKKPVRHPLHEQLQEVPAVAAEVPELSAVDDRRSVRAAVLGSPIGHSLSPVLHAAAYAALGLTWWRYEAIECDEAGLSPLLDRCGPDWAGLSLTMPLKRTVLPLLDRIDPLVSRGRRGEHGGLRRGAAPRLQHRRCWHGARPREHGVAPSARGSARKTRAFGGRWPGAHSRRRRDRVRRRCRAARSRRAVASPSRSARQRGLPGCIAAAERLGVDVTSCGPSSRPR